MDETTNPTTPEATPATPAATPAPEATEGEAAA